MSRDIYKRLSRAERKLGNTNKLRINNSTLKIKYEGIKKLLEKKDKEIERLNNIINELEHDFESYELEYLQDTYQGSLADFIETELEKLQELKGSDKE